MYLCMYYKDLVGKKSRRLTVIKFYGNNESKESLWLCSCSCGGSKIVRSSLITNKTAKSCGCLKKEILLARNTKHNRSKTKLYYVWAGMKARCGNKKHISYPWYGAKGVDVCKEWKTNYLSFEKWALNNGYKEGLCIGRINPNKNYSPSNCRFITQSQNNLESPKTIYFNGETATEASKRLGCLGKKADLVASRIRNGWEIEKAFTTPINKKGQHSLIPKNKNKILSLRKKGFNGTEIAREIGVQQPTISRFLQKYK